MLIHSTKICTKLRVTLPRLHPSTQKDPDLFPLKTGTAATPKRSCDRR